MDAELIMRAAAYAAEAHVRQKRKQGDSPYINHPLRVAHEAVCCGLSAEGVAAALLHDVVEDTPRTLKDLAAHFPPRVVALVDLMTQWWPDDAPAEVKREGKPKYYGAIAQDPEAVAIKLLDRADNLRDMARMLPTARGWAERYLKRSREEVGPLAALSENAAAVAAYESALEALEQALERTARKA